MSHDALPDGEPLLAVATREPADAPVVPQVPGNIPRRGSVLGQLVGRWGLVLGGWKVTGTFPDLRQFVIIVAPHTSNWDFIAGFWAYLALDLRATWFGKHTIFTWPFGALFRHFGGIPVRRESRDASILVERSAEEFARREQMLLAIAPEGTRKKVAEWKSGFWRIAQRAGVPIVPVALDFRLRRVIIGPAVRPTGDWDRDIAHIKGLYAGVTPRHPALF
jgi:1-acyl-sn-glycerol-3-phosphate acyltransferase